MNPNRLGKFLSEEFETLHPRLELVNILTALLPPYVGSRLRARLLGMIGFSIGQGTVFWGMPTITGGKISYQNLKIGNYCWINLGCLFDVSAPITIGDRVSFGQQVLLMTSTHQVGKADRRAGTFTCSPIEIGSGAWLGARCTVLPGVTIAPGAIVAAGAMVTQDVPANKLVAGVPARVIKDLEQPED